MAHLRQLKDSRASSARAIPCRCLILCCVFATGGQGGAAERGTPHDGREGDRPAAGGWLQGRLVDLTHPFDQRTIYWPTEKGFQLLPGPAGVTEQGYFYAANRFQAAEHGGTHLDAPLHFFPQGQTVDQIPLDRLVGEAAVIDVVEQCRADLDYQIGVGDLRRWEEQQGRQLVSVIVLLRTGYARHWSDRQRYLGTRETGPPATAQLHFPGLDPQAARWLVEHRSVQAVGIDTASIDYGQSRRFASHVTLFRQQIPVFENVANLEALPPAGASVIALPMKIAGGTGAPLRMIAVIPGPES